MSYDIKFDQTSDILTDCQHNFRSGRSCETQLLTTFQDSNAQQKRNFGLLKTFAIVHFDVILVNQSTTVYGIYKDNVNIHL